MEFHVSGRYTYQGTEGETSGELRIEDGEISGLLIDQGPGGRTQHNIEGSAQVQETDEGDVTILKFMKQPENPVKQEVSWLLERTEALNGPYQEPEQFAGDYEGGWTFGTDRDLIFTGTQYDPEVGVAMAIDDNPDREGPAYLTLKPV